MYHGKGAIDWMQWYLADGISLKPALVREGQRLLRLHRKAAVALERVLDACGEDAELWLRLRDQLCNHWREDVPQYRCFVSWVASNHMRTDAYRRLTGGLSIKFSERAGLNRE
jgi:hypothetical protein